VRENVAKTQEIELMPSRRRVVIFFHPEIFVCRTPPLFWLYK